MTGKLWGRYLGENTGSFFEILVRRSNSLFCTSLRTSSFRNICHLDDRCCRSQDMTEKLWWRYPEEKAGSTRKISVRCPNFFSCISRNTYSFRSLLFFDNSISRSRDMTKKLRCRYFWGGASLRSWVLDRFLRFIPLHLGIHTQNNVPSRFCWYHSPIARYDWKVFE